MQVGIVAQRGNAAARELGLAVADALDGDVVVRVDERTAADSQTELPGVPVSEMAGDALVVSIGGDGTFLFVARNVGATPILGVNLGEVGFLNAVSPDEAVEQVRAEVDRIRETGNPRSREVPRVEARVGDAVLPPALNEIVVQGPQRGPGQGVDLAVRVDDSTYFEAHADGVVVATQTGSTAYNLSEGGPIVHPSASGLAVTPMCPAEPVPPVVVGGDRTIEIDASGPAEAIVASDGNDRRRVETPTTVEVRTAAEPALIAGPQSDFFEALDKIG